MNSNRCDRTSSTISPPQRPALFSLETAVRGYSSTSSPRYPPGYHRRYYLSSSVLEINGPSSFTFSPPIPPKRPQIPLLTIEEVLPAHNALPTANLRSILDRIQDANKSYIPRRALGTDTTGGEDEVLPDDGQHTTGLPEMRFEQGTTALSPPESYTPQDKSEAFSVPFAGQEQVPSGPSAEIDHLRDDEIAALTPTHDDSSCPSKEETVQVKHEEHIVEHTLRRIVKEEPAVVSGGSGEGMEQPVLFNTSTSASGGTVGNGPSHEGSRTRGRGVKRGRRESPSTYWLRSQKPASSSKRSRRTRYWLRPGRKERI